MSALTYRLFRLINESGQSLSLSGGAYFLENPAGLGTAPDTPANDIRNGFFRVGAKDVMPQETVTGDIICRGYTEYKQLADFIMTAKELTLGYTPHGSTSEYFRRVTLGSLTKTEINAGRRLRCPLVLKAMTPWYISASVPLTVSTSSVATFFGKTYEAEIPKQGHLPIALKVTTSGGAIPHWLLAAKSIEDIGEDGENLYTVVMMPTTEAETFEGDTFVYCSDYEDAYIRILSEGETVDMLDKVVFTNNLFGRIPNGCGTAYLYLVFDENETNIPTMQVEAFYYYRSV